MNQPIVQTFKRYEKKYRLTTAQRAEFIRRVQPFMRPDDYGTYTIGSLYLDTPDFRLIRASLEKPVYKEKLRLRSYGVPQAEDTVFLELKKKFKGVVYKRRTEMPLAQAAAYLRDGTPPAKTDQIFREIDFTMRRLEPAPRVYLAYDRTAYAGRRDDRLRITFDTCIRWRTDPLDLSAGDGGRLLLGPDDVLMEIKIPDAMPLWLVRALTDMGLFPASFSKYGTCYARYLSVGQKAGLPAGAQQGGILSA